jgi:hypothetical protein
VKEEKMSNNTPTPTLAELREAVAMAEAGLKAAKAELAEAVLARARKDKWTAWLASDERVEEVVLDQNGQYTHHDYAYGDVMLHVLVVDGKEVRASFGERLRLFSFEEEAKAWSKDPDSIGAFVVVNTTVALVNSRHGVITEVEGIGFAELQDFDDPDEAVIGCRVVVESRHERGCLDTLSKIPFGEVRGWRGKQISCFRTRSEADSYAFTL